MMEKKESSRTALIEFLTKEKTASQNRMRQTALFLKDAESSATSWASQSAVTVRESLEILRQNAEADYDCILHLIAVLQRHHAKKQDSEESSSVPPSYHSEEATTQLSSFSNQIDIDPLTEGFEYEDGLPINDDRVIDERESNPEEEDDDNEDDCVYKSRYERGQDAVAKSLPVSVPWPTTQNYRLTQEERKLPTIADTTKNEESVDPVENIHRDIATIARSLHADAFELPLPRRRFSYKAD